MDDQIHLHNQSLEHKQIDKSLASHRKRKKFPWPSTNNYCFLISLFFILFSTFDSVAGKKWDGVNVTQSDYQALNALKSELVDPRGFLRSWNGSRSGACSGSWAGITCTKGRVIAIQLPGKGLGGTISNQISLLQGLRKLSLHDNALSGPVPAALGLLPNLQGVYLFNNRLTGPIPGSIFNSPLLQSLDVSNNQLTGPIPPSLANSTRLYRLNLSYNAITGHIPTSLTQSHSLTFLALQHNNLSGPIPDSWGGKSSNESYSLRSLALDHNSLDGNIPVSLSKLGSIEEINLSHNKIDGEIPNELTNLRNLSTFDVSYNNLSGSVPSIFAKKFSSSSFVGNIQLCGYSTTTPCTSSPPSPSPENQPAASPESRPSPSKGSRKKRGNRKISTKDIILIFSGALLIILFILCCVLLCCLIRKKAASRAKNGKNRGLAGPGKQGPAAGADIESGGEAGGGGKLVHFDGPFVFSADDLLCATAEIMGKSNYGTAYKATMEDGNVVAVKRLREKITKERKEFEIEVAELGKIRHSNILALRAYYLGPKGEKLLVYDYMPNGSLASFLHARGPERTVPWPTRMTICIGITRGLCYLHTGENMVHGNLTSSNILLDEHNIPKIADVGLSRLVTSAANTNMVGTAGTTGYRAPELSKMKSSSPKGDVYSLGGVILELLTGKSPGEPIDGLNLPQWVASVVKEEWTNEVFDLELVRNVSNDVGEELLSTLKLALNCVDPSPGARPEAQEVLQKLEEIRPDLASSMASTSGDDRATIPAKIE